MPVEFKLPDLGEGIHEAEVLAVKVKEGQTIVEDEPLFEVETDKAVVEIPSPYAGVISKILVAAGEIVKVGKVMIEVTEPGSDAKPKEADQAQVRKNGSAKPLLSATSNGDKSESKGASSPLPQAKDNESPVPAAPATRRLARELGVDLRLVPASGDAGRVLKEDVRDFAARALEPMVKDGLAFQQGTGKRLGMAQGANGGSASDGSQTKNLESKYGGGESAHQDRAPLNYGTAASDLKLPDFAKYGPIERIPLRSIRRKTAESMARSWAHIPHVTHCDEVDLTRLESVRAKHDPEVRKHGGKLTFTVLVLKAVASALKKYPQFNASLDEENSEIIFKHYYNIGVAVATERGLIVPVVRDVDQKSLIELAVELTELAERTRAGRVELDRLKGGTFTLTNIGAIGGTSMSPMINYPEAAILGMAKAVQKPIVKEGRIEIGLIMPFALSFDHRIADGAEAAYFVRHIITRLEDPFTFLLEA